MANLPRKASRVYFNGFWYKRDFLSKLVTEMSGLKDDGNDEALAAIVEDIVKGAPTRYALFASRLDEERARW